MLDQRIPLAGVAHQCGTVRFGDDPATSALDVDCKAHDARQPLRRRHELLPVVERGEPGADRDGQRAARRRPPARAPRRHASPTADGSGRRAAPGGARMNTRRQRRQRDRQGPRRRLRRHRRDDGLDARSRRGCAAARRARRRPARRPRCSGSSEFEDDLAAGALQRPLALGLRHRLGRRARPARRDRAARRGRATAAHGAAISGQRQVTLPGARDRPAVRLLGARRRSRSTPSTTRSTRPRPALAYELIDGRGRRLVARKMQVRVARPPGRLEEVVAFYRNGLGLPEIGRFRDHDATVRVLPDSLAAAPGTGMGHMTTDGGHGRSAAHPESLLVLPPRATRIASRGRRRPPRSRPFDRRHVPV